MNGGGSGGWTMKALFTAVVVASGCSNHGGMCEKYCENRECGPTLEGCSGSCGTCESGTKCNDEGICIQCNASCEGRECGSDGCGGSCGTCPTGSSCTPAGECQGALPCCEIRECGLDPCAGVSCGTCAEGMSCNVLGHCVCTPDCGNRECGSDGCGGTCGTCRVPETCGEDGVCSCVPDCEGRVCGDDGCSGTCGECGANETCVEVAEGLTACDCLQPYKWFDWFEVPEDYHEGIAPGPIIVQQCDLQMNSEYFNGMYQCWDQTPPGEPPPVPEFISVVWDEEQGILSFFPLVPEGFRLRQDGTACQMRSFVAMKFYFTPQEARLLEYDGNTGEFRYEFFYWPEIPCWK